MTEEGTTDQAPEKKTQELAVVQQGPISPAKAKANHLWSLAQRYAESAIVPDIFQNKPDDCFIALQMADRMNVDPLMLMQSAFLVHGKLGFEAKFTTGLVNNSDLIVGRLKYEERPEPGTDPFDQMYAVRAFATDKETDQEVYGEWITWTLVKAEGWHLDKKTQKSKWMTMPGQMFHYRAATFFTRRHYPEVLLGMKTTDEIIDADFTVTNTDRTQALKDRISGPPPAADSAPSKECPKCKGPLIQGEKDDCPHCGVSLIEEIEEPAEPVSDTEKEEKEKQNKLWGLCEQLSGGDVIKTEATLREISGTISLEMVHGEDLDKAIAAAEELLKKPKGKKKGSGKKTGDLFEK